MRSLRRGWAAACAAAYFVTNVAAAHAVEKSLWEERRVALRRTTWGARAAPVARFAQVGSLPIFDGGSTPSQPPSNFFKAAVPFDVASTALPFGAVSEMREGRPGAPVVFLVQDVHGNDGAQKNIGGLLTDWAARGVTLVGVEGAWVSIDLAAFHRHPSPRSVSLVADALRKAGWLSGAEWAGMTTSVPLDLVGVESPDLYRTNVRAARDCVARRPTVETFLKNLSHALQNQKDRFYSPQLKAFDLHIKDFHEGREGLGAYARSLSDLPGSGVQAGPQVKKFLKAVDWESRLNFEKVEADRQALMDRLTRDLGRKELNGLFSQAVAYRTGKQTNGDFFSYLKTLCAKTRTPLASYQSFADYIAYVGLVQSINRADLLSELAMWETGLAGRLANTPEERRLVAMDRDVSLLRRLLENEMSPDDWAQFKKRRNEIVALPARLREFGDFQEPQGGMDALFRSHEEFCRLAMARNGVLVSNLMSQIQSRKASRAVLVAGGFHTPGLQSELMKRGCSTVVVTPRIDKVEGKPLDVFARDPLPFDHLFAGKPISLSPELMTGNPERITVLNMAITMDALGSADRQEGLRTVRFNVAGKELLASMGPERSLDEMSKNYPRLGPVLIKDQTYFVVCAHPKTGWGFGDRARRMHDGLNMSLTVFGKLLTWFVFPWMASRMWIVPPSDGVDLFSQKNEPLASATTILAEPYLRYNAKVREIVHPYAGPYCVLYGGSGVDVSNALLISNFTRAFFVSPTHGLSVSDLMRIKEEGVREDPLYAQEKYVNGFSDASRISGKTKLLSSLSLELKGMSIPLSSLEGFEWKGRPAVRFYWSAPGESVPTLREIIFVDADITQPAQYSDVLLERFDLYLQRAGMLIPWSYRDRNSFIKVIERSMNPDGFFATDDFALNEPGEFIALMQSFPLELPLLSIPEEMNLLDQVIDLRSKKRGLRVWANQTRNGYGFLLSIRPMSIPSRGGGKIFPMEKAKKKPLHEEVDRLLTKVESLPSFDPRPVNSDLLAEPYARYAETVRRIVNPKGMPSTILYGGAGADVSHALLMAHFTRAFFVSSYKKLTLADLARVKQGEKNGVAQYRQEKREDGFADGSRLNSSADIVSALSIELQSMGVSLESIEFIQWKGRPGIRFLWQGAAEDLPITREIIFVDADITEPAQYKDVLSEKFDLYLQRAGMRIPYSYRKANGFIEEISRSMNPGAYFVTDDSALEEAGIFIDLGQYFPLKLRVVPIPFEQELLDQVISLRYIDRPGLKQLAMRESEGYGFLCRIRQMPDLSLSADMSGALSNKKHRTLSEAQGLPGGVSTNNLFFLPVGTPFDPLIGLTVAVLFLGAMLFKREILNWLKGRVPPRVYVFTNFAIPDLSGFRPRIASFFIRVIGILIEQSVKILGRLFGIGQLQVPPTLGILPENGKPIESISSGPSSRLDDIVTAMDSSDIQGIYEHLAHYFGLWGVAADVGSSSYDLPAKGLLAGGMEKVSLVDHLHREKKTITTGIEVVPGDATILSQYFGDASLDAIVFHRSPHHIVVDKESRSSAAGQELIKAENFPDNIVFHVDLLSRVLGETFKTLKPGGRVLLYFDAHTFRVTGSPGLFGWSLEDMLTEKGFEDVSLITSKNGTVVATGVRPNRSLGNTIVAGIGVSRRSVNDTLDKADREVFSKALGAIVPNVFDMQGVEVLIDPRQGAFGRNLVEELKNKMGVNRGVAGEKSPKKLEGIIQQDPASIHWVRGFSSRPNGVNSLAETCVEAARTGDARASGAALAAWDDSKFLAGPNPEIVAALLAVLIGDKKGQAVVLADQFAEAYNRARAGLLLPKLLSGTLMKPSNGSDLRSGILLNISALFDRQADDAAKNNTWLALAAALSARERNPNVPLGLVVHGVNVNEQIVTDTLSRSVPRWANFMTDGVSLFVQGNTVGKTVFVNDKFSLKALRTNSLWNRPLTVLGLSAETIDEPVDQLESVDLIPLDVFVNKQLQQVLHRLRFVFRNA